MYIETSHQHTNAKARLLSPIYHGQNQAQCLQFWYNMYGTSVEQLNVYMKKRGVLGTPIWRKHGKKVLFTR